MRRSALAVAVVATGLVLSAQIPGSADEPVPLTVDTAQQAGLYDGVPNKTWAATPVDYDSDGDQDVWIGYHQHGGVLWNNNGDGTYTRVVTDAWSRVNTEGQIPDRHDCAWADVDLDGRPDAYCSTGRNRDNYVKTGKDNELWLQRSPGQFTEVGTEFGVGDMCGRGRHVSFLDVNHDGYPDIFSGTEAGRLVADPCDDPVNGLPNENSKIFLNLGGTGFRYAPEYKLATNSIGQRCAVTLDIDGDGLDDLLACNFKDRKPKLYRNGMGVRLNDATWAQHLTAMSDAVAVDLDLDGDTDLVSTDVTGVDYRLNTAGKLGTPVRIATVPVGAEGRSVAVGDADGDGDLDVYAMIGSPPAPGFPAGTTNPDDVLLINTLLSFTPVAVPSATGLADEVIALTPGPDARASFLVLNGRETNGPVQLISLAVPPPPVLRP